MKTQIITLLLGLFVSRSFAQLPINDESIRYQQERMVFKQWDQDRFTPKSGFLGLNPYYWLTWGLMPSYKKTDLRPLGPSGPQTRRLALVGAMQGTDNSYKLQADTLRNTAISQAAGQSGALSSADPLWIIYYARELQPVMTHPQATILGPLPEAVRVQVIAQGIYAWFAQELDMLKQRLEAARTADMDRGARILAYHRILLAYRVLAATWSTRTANAAANNDLAVQQQKLKAGLGPAVSWTPQTDVQIAQQVIVNRAY